MPDSKEHKEKAIRNRSFLEKISGLGFDDWSAVVAFYTALHCIERLASCDSTHNGSHIARRKFLSSTGFRSIQKNYQSLYDAAHIARYGTLNKFEKAFTNEVLQKQIIGVDLVAIEKFVDVHFERLLSKSNPT